MLTKYQTFVKEIMSIPGVKGGVLATLVAEPVVAFGFLKLDDPLTHWITDTSLAIAAHADSGTVRCEHGILQYEEFLLLVCLHLELIWDSDTGPVPLFPLILFETGVNIVNLRMKIQIEAQKVKNQGIKTPNLRAINSLNTKIPVPTNTDDQITKTLLLEAQGIDNQLYFSNLPGDLDDN